MQSVQIGNFCVVRKAFISRQQPLRYVQQETDVLFGVQFLTSPSCCCDDSLRRKLRQLNWSEANNSLLQMAQGKITVNRPSLLSSTTCQCQSFTRFAFMSLVWLSQGSDPTALTSQSTLYHFTTVSNCSRISETPWEFKRVRYYQANIGSLSLQRPTTKFHDGKASRALSVK